MHYTINNPQSQLLTVLEGKIFDCLVDLRKSSKSFLENFFHLYLNRKKKNQIYIYGIAHSFCVLSNKAILHYNTSMIFINQMTRWIDMERQTFEY